MEHYIAVKENEEALHVLTWKLLKRTKWKKTKSGVEERIECCYHVEGKTTYAFTDLCMKYLWKNMLRNW